MATKLMQPAALVGMHTAGIYSDMTVDGPEIGTLVVIVDRAKNLPNRKTMGKQNPYCAARLGKEAKKTETDRRGGQTPKWDQELRFTVHDSPDYHNLKVSLFNDDKKTDLIGETWVNLEPVLLPGGGRNDLWHGLNCKGKYAGEVRIELTYYDTRPKQESDKRRERSKTSIDGLRRHSVSDLGQHAVVKRRPLPSNPARASPSPPILRDYTPPIATPQPVRQGYDTNSARDTFQDHDPSAQEYPNGQHKVIQHRYSFQDGYEQRGQLARPLSNEAFTRSLVPPRSLPLAPGSISHPVPANEMYESDPGYEQLLPHGYEYYEDDVDNAQSTFPIHQNQDDYIPGLTQPIQRQQGNESRRDFRYPGNFPRDQRRTVDNLPNGRHDFSLPHPSSLHAATQGTPREARQPQPGFYSERGAQSVLSRHPIPNANSVNGYNPELQNAMQPNLQDLGSGPPPPPAHRIHATPPAHGRTPPNAVIPWNYPRKQSPVPRRPRSVDVSPFSTGQEMPPLQMRGSGRGNYSPLSTQPVLTRDGGPQSTTPGNNRYEDIPDSGELSRAAPAWARPPGQTQPSNLPAGYQGRGSPYNETQPVSWQAENYPSTFRSPWPHQYQPPNTTPSRLETFARHDTSPSNALSHRESPLTQSQQELRLRRDTAPIIKPIAVSPDARVYYRTNQSTPLRQSVNSQPSSSPAEQRLPGIPYSPDSFDGLNPNARSASLDQPGARYKSPAEAEEAARQHQREVLREDGPIIGKDGRVIDPSDHLPIDSWAPEPERKTGQKIPVTVRARLSPRGAQPMPTAASQPLREQIARGQQDAARSSISRPSSFGRVQSQQPQPQSPGLPNAPSPLAGSGPGTPRSLPGSAPVGYSPREYSEYGYNGSPSPGYFTDSWAHGGPPVPAKVPYYGGASGANERYQDEHLKREMMSIDIGRNDDQRARRTRYGP